MSRPEIPEASTGNVVLRGHISVPDHRIDAIRVALREHIFLTRAEVGCIYFDVTEDLHVKGRFNVFEIFQDRAAFDLHQYRAKSSEWAMVSTGIKRDYVVSEVGA